MARGVEDFAYAHRFAVMLCNSDENLAKEEFYIDVLRAESVDGIMLPPISEADPVVHKLIEAGVRVVTVDRSLAQGAVDKVVVDNRRGAREAVEYLIKLGHRRIGLITGRLDVSTSRERLRGFKEAMSAHNIPLRENYIRGGDFKQSSGRALAEELLGLSPPPTAFFVLNNLMTMRALEAIHRLNLMIPKDIPIID